MTRFTMCLLIFLAAPGLATALGSPDFAWLSFQTLWDEVVDEASDFAS